MRKTARTAFMFMCLLMEKVTACLVISIDGVEALEALLKRQSQ